LHEELIDGMREWHLKNGRSPQTIFLPRKLLAAYCGLPTTVIGKSFARQVWLEGEKAVKTIGCCNVVVVYGKNQYWYE